MLLVSREHERLLVPRGPVIDTMFPAEPILENGTSYRVVPHDLATMVLLDRLGLRVPHPMLEYYDWKGGTPFQVQQDTCALLTSAQRCYVLNDMGTGKTKAALWAFDYLRGKKLCGRGLVVAPLSTLKFVWAAEAFATVPNLKVQVLHGSKQQRLERLNDPDADLFVINHDGVPVIYEELMSRADIDLLILDELATYRNVNDRSRAMFKLARRFPWVWGMTGRPMPNSPLDVWAQCRIITPNSVPKRMTHARDALMTRISQFKWVPKQNSIQTAFSYMQPAVRYKLDDVVELPEVINRDVTVPLSSTQEKAYKTLASEFAAMVQGKAITAQNAGVLMSKLLQVASGWVYTGDFGNVPLDPYPRLSALIDLIESAENKVIVFVPFRHALTGISAELTKNGIEHAVVHGDTVDREDIFNDFQNTSKYPVLAAHPVCMAHGLTLTAADTIIWYCPTTSLEVYEQANARIRRVGQKHKQQVLNLQGTPVERKIIGLLRSHQRAQDKLLELFEEATTGGLGV